jgi:hypothetical protein
MDSHDMSNKKEISGRIQANTTIRLRNAIRMHGTNHKELYWLTSRRR